jgi:Fe-S-cluster containining protein
VAEPWYRDGLRFACTRCGNCCRGAGTVRVSDAEIAALARRLELTDAEFRAVYTRRLRGGEVSLRERANRDCVFYEARPPGCRVYEDRPAQCRTWPFWPSVLHSTERWQEEAAGCPGMNRGRLHTAPEIEETAEARRSTSRAPTPV